MNIRFEKKFRPDIPGGLRTDIIWGQCQSLPVSGHSFSMVAEPLEGGDFRHIITSPVKGEVLHLGDDVVRFATDNGSIYEITVIK